jgi:histidinol-phosphatase (PHP family)
MQSAGFFLSKTKQQAYARYLEAIYHSLCNFKDYDVVGHIGYVRRYGNYGDTSMLYEDYKDILDEILCVVIRDGKGIEINTSGFAYNLGTAIPDITILQRYYDLGGRIVTLGSDAHSVGRVAADFDYAMAMLQYVGFTSFAYFKERKPIFEKI